MLQNFMTLPRLNDYSIFRFYHPESLVQTDNHYTAELEIMAMWPLLTMTSYNLRMAW